MSSASEPLTLETALLVIAELRALVKQQAARIAELEEKLRKDSSNSSKPPSTDGPAKKKYPKKKPSERKRGAQKGHKKHERTLLAVEGARSVIQVIPSECERCAQPLQGKDPEPKRHQIVDLPPIVPVYDEYQLHTLTCTNPECGHKTEASLPEGVSTLGYGPGVDAMVGHVAGAMRASKRLTAETMNEVFGVPMSVGAVIDCQNRVSQALQAPVEQAVKYVQEQPIKNADETGWKEEGKKAYIWVCVTAFVTAFVIQPSRAAKVAGMLLGTLVMGILGTDRYSGYSWWPGEQRQLCWSHLIRDFRAIAERGGSSEVLGQGLLAEAERMFGWWSRYKLGEITRRTFQVYMRSVQQRVADLLFQGRSDSNEQTAGTCKKMWEVQQSFWTFVREEGVEPTNNAAEQALRFAVLWRKMSYGTKSVKGSEFVARILTARTTLRQQKRSVYEYLRAACEAYREGKPIPSLLPR